jgi:hypothetical protein
VKLSALDTSIVVIHAIGIFIVAQWVSREKRSRVELRDIDHSTSTGFNVAAVVITAILVALYATWW